MKETGNGQTRAETGHESKLKQSNQIRNEAKYKRSIIETKSFSDTRKREICECLSVYVT